MHHKETCTAGAGTVLLEFGILSRLLGDPTFEALARKSLASLWKRRSVKTGLFGKYTSSYILRVSKELWFIAVDKFKQVHVLDPLMKAEFCCELLTFKWHIELTSRLITSGADPGFFLGGGALFSCSTSRPINHIVWQNTSCIRKPQVISGGGGMRTPCTLPLDPPLHI